MVEVDDDMVARVAGEAAGKAAEEAVRALLQLRRRGANDAGDAPPPPAAAERAELGVRKAAKVLRVRSSRLAAVLAREVEAGREIPGEERGTGQRKHFRLDPERLEKWWASVEQEVG